jgi:pimeloyl-ACP methyl ester carboxylesterase
MLGFERRAQELSGASPDAIDAHMHALARYFVAYLLDREDPATIEREQPSLAGTWQKIVGTGAATHYGRPLAFHQQAAAQDWAAAWGRVNAPVLALYGEYDWFEDAEAHRLVADIANRRQGGQGEFVVIPATDHHFDRFPDARAAYKGEGGANNADAAVSVMLRWLGERRPRESASRP